MTPKHTPTPSQASSPTSPIPAPSPRPKLKLFASLASKWTLVRRALLAHYSAPQAQQFKTLRNGFLFFAIGLATVLITNTAMPPSLEQELVILLGLIVGTIGFFIAILAYIRIVISRVVTFINKK